MSDMTEQTPRTTNPSVDAIPLRASALALLKCSLVSMIIVWIVLGIAWLLKWDLDSRGTGDSASAYVYVPVIMGTVLLAFFLYARTKVIEIRGRRIRVYTLFFIRLIDRDLSEVTRVQVDAYGTLICLRSGRIRSFQLLFTRPADAQRIAHAWRMATATQS
jgi:hypothetical protein